MPTPVNHRSETPLAQRQGRLRARRLVRGGAVNTTLMVVLGFIFIGVGVAVKGQEWTRPAQFAGLGLDLAQTITNIGIILAFWKVVEGFFYVPLKNAMDARNSELERTFAEAEGLKAQMTQLRNGIRKLGLAKTEAEAREQIQSQIKEVQVLRQTLMSEATAKADEMLKKAEQDIESERLRVRNELRREVISLSFMATERLIGKNVDDATNRKLVEEFIDTAAVVS